MNPFKHLFSSPSRAEVMGIVIVGFIFTAGIAGGTAVVITRNAASSSDATVADDTTTTSAVQAEAETSTTTAEEPATPTAPATRPVTRPVSPPPNPTATAATTPPAQPATTSTTALVPPSLTGLTVRPANWYASWTYSDAVSLSWTTSGTVDGVTITYGTTTLNSTGGATLVTGLTPDTDYTFSVAAFNQAGESPSLTAMVHTRPDTAPVLSSIVKRDEGSFLVSAPDLSSAFVYLVVPGIDTAEHPPQPVCSSYSQEGQNQAECVFTGLDAGHWQIHSIRIVNKAGRSTSYFRNGRLVEYNLAAGSATTVAGPYQKSTLDLTTLDFDI